MPSVYDLKPKFQSLLRPLVNKAAARGVTPNQITLIALALSVIAGMLIWMAGGAPITLFLVPPVLFMRMALNAMDGMLAREHQMTSRLGQALNEGGDVLADIALYLPFAVVAGLIPALVVLLVITGILTECAGILAQAMMGTRRYDGPMGKSDRALFFGTISLLLALHLVPPPWINILLLAALGLGVRTIFNRVRPALGETP
jgi:phosphatidylglycerophosphate synthase